MIRFMSVWCLFDISKIAIVVVVGIDDDSLDNNLGVNHDELQGVTAGCCVKRGVEPTQIVEHLVAARKLTTVHESTQGETAARRQGL